jgi:hypothetical protein
MKDFKVSPCERKDIKDFIETWHYSKSINGVKSNHCFKLMQEDKIVGAAIFSQLAMANVWKKYVEKESDLIELRRLCCIDDTPKNTESFFISQCIRWIKKNYKYKKLISYADANYGHIGIIYKASNFKFMGVTGKARMISYNGRLYHDKTIRTKYNGTLKPYAQKIKKALESGEAFYIDSLYKFIYLYDLNNNEKFRQS